jgi:CheY-like chemotaxis protein
VKTVLIVDDDVVIRKLIRDALHKRFGWTVLEAEDGVDGVARFILHRPDILITDITMPNSDGFEMLDVLQQSDLLRGTKVVIMSGVLNMETLRVRSKGASALLSKPFNLVDLYAAVGEPPKDASSDKT